MRMKRPGTYAPLATHYYDDPKIIEAGEEAEVLYTRMLAYASGQPEAEGVIPDAVVRFRLGLDIEATGKGTGKGTGNRIERLEHAGLVEREGDSWRIVAWLKWNRSGAEIDRDRANDRRRKKPVTRGDTGRGTGKGTGKGTGIRTENVPDSSTPDTDTDTDTPLTTFEGGAGGDVPDVAGSHVVADAPTQTTKAKRGTRLPEGWTPERSQANLKAEHDSGLTPDELSSQLDRFRDHWTAQPGSKGTKLDWQATWRNWVRRAAEMAPRTRQSETDAWYARAKARASNPNPLLSLLADDASPSDDPGRPAMPPRSA